jgi:hypothetical protein
LGEAQAGARVGRATGAFSEMLPVLVGDVPEEQREVEAVGLDWSAAPLSGASEFAACVRVDPASAVSLT